MGIASWPGFINDWGSTEQERAQPYPCERLVARPDLVLHRAIDVAAPAATVFRWLCQLRAAPYSYDLLDNGGRRSPQELTPGLERLEPGQRMMKVFRLIEHEPGVSVTMLSEGRLFGRVACTYRVGELSSGRSRLVVKLLVERPSRTPAGRAVSFILPPGDLVMMRRQLMNLRRLAEAQDAAAAGL